MHHQVIAHVPPQIRMISNQRSVVSRIWLLTHMSHSTHKFVHPLMNPQMVRTNHSCLMFSPHQIRSVKLRTETLNAHDKSAGKVKPAVARSAILCSAVWVARMHSSHTQFSNGEALSLSCIKEANLIRGIGFSEALRSGKRKSSTGQCEA